MKITELRELLKDKRVIEEINKHLWIESQKVGYSIGIERATDEWLKLYAMGWMRYNAPAKYDKAKSKKKDINPKKTSVKKAVVKAVKKVVKKTAAKSKKVVKK